MLVRQPHGWIKVSDRIPVTIIHSMGIFQRLLHLDLKARPFGLAILHHGFGIIAELVEVPLVYDSA